MKVAELIEILKNHDPEAIVIVDGYEEGYTEAMTPQAAKVKLDKTRPWWAGEFEDAVNGISAVLIARK